MRVKIQAGSHEHEHNGSINALGWMQGGSGLDKRHIRVGVIHRMPVYRAIYTYRPYYRL
ncbi:MAG: hypothetical protein IPP36_10935 [Nitrosomonadales bacterium]|nr:hypothetical protein [Nitrosomonadales bacterium]